MGAAYLLSGVGCVVALGWNPFLLVFLAPGALLVAAAALATAGGARP